MPEFGASSKVKLMTCHPDLVRLFNEVVNAYDCQVIDGARTEADQEDKVKRGFSKTLDSKHVVSQEHPLSRAADVAPYPVVWPLKLDAYPTPAELNQYVHTIGRFYDFHGFVLATANLLGIKIRWGGDWDMDKDFMDQTFDDLDHFELAE